MGRREGGEGQRCEHGMLKEFGVTRKHTLISNDHWLTLYNSHGLPWFSTPPKSRRETVDKDYSRVITGWGKPDSRPSNGACTCWATTAVMGKPPTFKGTMLSCGLRIIICETETELTGWRHWEMGATSKSGLYGWGMSSSTSAVWVLWL